MTAKQLDFIKTLIAERETAGLTPDQQQFLARVHAGHVDPTPAQASRIIEKLLSLPRREAAPERGGSFGHVPAVNVAAGRYAIVDETDGRIRFFVVDRPTEGRWIGRTFVSEQASDEKYPVRGDRRYEVLGAIAADPAAAMRRYAAELGRCGFCGRTLTDEVSRAAGIGPDCADRHGVDRSVWAAAAMAEAAARVRGPVEETTAGPQQEAIERAIARDENEIAAEGGRSTLDDDEPGENLPPAPAAPENATHAAGETFSSLRAAAGRPDPSKALGWRERKAKVAEQQGASRGRYAATAAASGRVHMGELPGTTWEAIFGMEAGS